MAVYPINKSGNQFKCLQVSKQFELFDTVEIILKDGSTKYGEIIYIEDDVVMITGPYLPITEIELHEIDNIRYWRPPAYW